MWFNELLPFSNTRCISTRLISECTCIIDLSCWSPIFGEYRIVNDNSSNRYGVNGHNNGDVG